MIRFFDKNMCPLSTAMWDPKWFHDNQGEDHVFIHKSGITYGMKTYPLIPAGQCTEECRGRDACKTKDPDTCDFLRHYREQLDKIDFQGYVEELEGIVGEEGTACLIFHEDPTNPCSERWVVQQWFKDNGYPIEEWKGNGL